MRSWSTEGPNRHRPLRAISAIVTVALVAAACSSSTGIDNNAPSDTASQGVEATVLPVVVTTDLGPGDVIALAFLFGHPDIQVIAVAVDGGVLTDCEVGVDHVLRLAAAAGTSTVVSCGDVPQGPAAAAAPAALRNAAADLYGLQLPATDDVPDNRPPAEVIAASVAAAPAEVRILTLGPLTHVATALQSSVDVAGAIGHIYALGGPAGPGNGEANFALDSTAVISILESDVPLTILPSAAATAPIVTDAFDTVLESAATPAGELLSQIALGLDTTTSSTLWGEPLAAAILSDESVGAFEMAQVQIEQSGVLSETPGGRRVRLLRQPHADTLTLALSVRFGGAEDVAAPQQPNAAPAEGRLVWQFALDRGADELRKSRSALSDGVLYLVGFDGRLYALDSMSGDVVWSRDLEEGESGQVEVAISPDAVFVSDRRFGPNAILSSSIAAFDRNTGGEVWRIVLDPDTEGGARNLAYSEGWVIYGVEKVGMIGADAATGATLWTYPVAVAPISGAANVTDGVVYFGAADGAVYALDATTGTELWRVPTRPSGRGVTSSPAVVNGVAYFGSDSGQVLAVDAATGDVIWETDVSPVQGIPSSPVVGDGRLYFGTLGPTGSSELAGIIALDASTGARVWSVQRPGERVISSPTYVDGVLYVLTRATGALTALDGETGVELWSFDLGGPGTDSPVVGDGVVYFQANGNVFAVAPPE